MISECIHHAIEVVPAVCAAMIVVALAKTHMRQFWVNSGQEILDIHHCLFWSGELQSIASICSTDIELDVIVEHENSLLPTVAQDPGSLLRYVDNLVRLHHHRCARKRLHSILELIAAHHQSYVVPVVLWETANGRHLIDATKSWYDYLLHSHCSSTSSRTMRDRLSPSCRARSSSIWS